MSKTLATLFHCPVCSAKYEVVGFEPRQGRPPRAKWRAFAAAAYYLPAKANFSSNTS